MSDFYGLNNLADCEAFPTAEARAAELARRRETVARRYAAWAGFSVGECVDALTIVCDNLYTMDDAVEHASFWGMDLLHAARLTMDALGRPAS